ncbi:MAG: HIT domain-containing protein [Candidatus Woesearchaeota archaeon]
MSDPAQQCIFCKIINGEIPSQKVYESEHILVIADINPHTKGHMLVLPKEHMIVWQQAKPECLAELSRVIFWLSKAQQKVVVTNTVKGLIAGGGVAGQQMPHAVMHLLPEHAFPEPTESIEPNSQVIQKIQATCQQYLKKAPEKPAQPAPDTKKQLAQLLESNEQLRNALMNEPQKFANLVKEDKHLQQLFEGVDIESLAKKLKEAYS